MSDLQKLSQELGINMQAGGGYNTAFQRGGTKTTPAKTSDPLGYVKNVAKTVTGVPLAFGQSVVQGVAKGFRDTAGGISQAITGGQQQRANDAYRQALEEASRKYDQLYASGKLSKEAYAKLSKDIIAQSQGLSNDINKQVSEMVSPQDFATGLASTAAIPFAFGGLSVAEGATGAAATTARVLGATSKVQDGAKAAAAAGAKAAIKYPLVTNPVAQAPLQLAQDIRKGDTGATALDAATIAAPALIGGASKVLPKVAQATREAFLGKSAVLTDAFGRGRVSEYLANNPDKEAVLKQMELFTLDHPNIKGDAAKGGQFLADYLKSIGVDAKNDSLDKIIQQFSNYSRNVEKLNQGIANSAKAVFKDTRIPETAVVSADFTKALPKVVKTIEALGPDATNAEKIRALNAALDDAKILNETIRTRLADQILRGTSPEELVNYAKQKLIIKTPGVRLDKGFIATLGPKERATMPSLKAAGEAGMIDLGRKAAPILGDFANAAEKAGVGFRDFNPAQIGIARDKFIADVSKLLPNHDPRAAYDRLTSLAEQQNLTDLRQLHVGEVAQTLDISSADARKVIGITKNMYSEIPLSLRGAARKVQDVNLKYNPIAAPYARLQSKLRYGVNPFFRAQQRIEAATLGQVVTGGYSPAKDVSGTIKLMRESGFLPNANIGSTGETLLDVGRGTKITARLTRSEENSLGRVLEATAAKNGTSVKEELANEDTRRLLRAIVQNPKEGILSSNFARATNMLFFPSSYNAKVTGLALKALSKQPPAVQFGVIKSVNDFHNWLGTKEGTQWQRDNSEVIGLISYFTPINSIQQIYNAVSHGNPAELGVIGGLPFGVVQRVLEGQGVVPKSTPPYLDPKTGNIVPDKIPQTDMARIQQALRDILGTVFTFPGRQAGMGSKNDVINAATGGLLTPTAGGFKSVTRTDLTPSQKRTQGYLAAPKATAPTKAAPVINRSLPTIRPPRLVAPTSSGTRSKKKTTAKRIGQPF